MAKKISRETREKMLKGLRAALRSGKSKSGKKLTARGRASIHHLIAYHERSLGLKSSHKPAKKAAKKSTKKAAKKAPKRSYKKAAHKKTAHKKSARRSPKKTARRKATRRSSRKGR